MASVKAFKIGGIDMWIPSGDHRPEHFHARRRGEWSAKVYIRAPRDEMIELLRPPDATIKRNERKAIIEAVESHRAELLKEWDVCYGES